jgi:HSP20 family protein
MNMRQLIPWRRDDLAVSMDREDPFQALWQEVNRTFDTFFNEFSERPFGSGGGSFSPSIDVTESDDAFLVTAEIPGVAQDDVDVSLTKDALTIKGEKKVEQEEKEGGYYHLERRYGSFYRAIPLPPNVVDPEKVEASFDNGVLTITLPKLEKAQHISKRIPVQAG